MLQAVWLHDTFTVGSLPCLICILWKNPIDGMQQPVLQQLQFFMAPMGTLGPRWSPHPRRSCNPCSISVGFCLEPVSFSILIRGRLMGARRRRRSRYNTTTPMTTQQASGGYYGQQQPYNSNQQYAAPVGAPPAYGNDQAYNGYYGQQGGVAEPQNVYQPPK